MASLAAGHPQSRIENQAPEAHADPAMQAEGKAAHSGARSAGSESTRSEGSPPSAKRQRLESHRSSPSPQEQEASKRDTSEEAQVVKQPRAPRMFKPQRRDVVGTRDPRLLGDAMQRDPRLPPQDMQAGGMGMAGPTVSRGFQPLVVPQMAQSKQAQPSFTPQMRPLQDPLAMFNPKMKAKIREAMRAEKAARQLAKELEAAKQHPVFMPQTRPPAPRKPPAASRSATPTPPAQPHPNPPVQPQPAENDGSESRDGTPNPTPAASVPQQTASRQPTPMPKQRTPTPSRTRSPSVRPSQAQPEASKPAPPPAQYGNPGPTFRPMMGTMHVPLGIRPPTSVIPGPGVSNFRPISVPGPGARPPAAAVAQGLAEQAAPVAHPAQFRPMSAMHPQGPPPGRVKGAAGGSKEGVRVGGGKAGGEVEERKPAKRSHKKGASRAGQDQARPRQVSILVNTHTPEGSGNSAASEVTGQEWSSLLAASKKTSAELRMVDVTELLRQLRGDAASFCMPVLKADQPPRNVARLDDVPLLPSHRPIRHLDSTATASASQPGPGRCTGHVQLEEGEMELLHRFRCSKYLDEEEMPPLLAPAAEQPEVGVGSPAKRRSQRVRTTPVPYIPHFGRDTPVKRSEGGRHGDEFNLMEGPEYQAEIPVCRPKPPPGSEPTPQEAEWVEGLVMERGHFGGTGEPIRLVELQPGRGWFHSGGKPLTMEEASILGLNDAGIFGIFGWSMEDISMFEKGLDAHKRDFQRIYHTHLPGKDPQKIASFYYNVWKSKAIVQAIEWYQRRDLKRQAERLEAERLEKAQERERQRARERRREQDRERAGRLAREAWRQEREALNLAKEGREACFRKSLTWVRGVARAPMAEQTFSGDTAQVVLRAAKVLAQKQRLPARRRQGDAAV